MDTLTHKPASAQSLLELYPRLGIPHFQRGLVWNEDATGLLLESLYFGTPCGNIILWKPLAPEIHGEPIQGQTQCELLLVDGQQRVRMLHAARADVEDPAGKIWCLDLTVEPNCSPLLRDPARRSLFIFAEHPKRTKNARYKQNLIPLTELAEYPIAELKARYDIQGKSGVSAGEIVEAVAAVANVVKVMWARPLFNIIQLNEQKGQLRDKTYGIDYIVSLYNRINSAGRKVEQQEIAYATIVHLYPETTACLKNFFKDVHPQKGVERDTLLRREKERNFGFKLYLRTLVQVCNYHFGRSQGTQMFSFDILKSSDFSGQITQNREYAGMFFKWTHMILVFVHEVLCDSLFCDDLRMLPDIDCLIPALQLLIRYPRLIDTRYKQIIAYLILRTAIDPERTQESTLKLVRYIERTHDAGSCIKGLPTQFGAWSEDKGNRFRNALASANTMNDRYVLLLYWLARRTGAKDFSYANLSSNKPLSHRAGKEMVLSTEVVPEKQHIAPAADLSRDIYGGDSRITTSRHPINNIGNLTYISRELNHFESGLGPQWIDPTKETDPAVLAGHFLQGEALDLYEKLRSRALSKADKDLFEQQYCKARRELIQAGFEAWMDEVQKGLDVVDERIKQKKKLIVPDTADKIRWLDYPNRIEDALLMMLGGQMLKLMSEKAKKNKPGDIIFQLQDSGSKSKANIFMFRVPRRIEIEHRDGHGVLAKLESIMEQAGIEKQPNQARPWVLPCGPDEESLTAGILEVFYLNRL